MPDLLLKHHAPDASVPAAGTQRVAKAVRAAFATTPHAWSGAHSEPSRHCGAHVGTSTDAGRPTASHHGTGNDSQAPG